jgi:hypothetical protein
MDEERVTIRSSPTERSHTYFRHHGFNSALCSDAVQVASNIAAMSVGETIGGLKMAMGRSLHVYSERHDLGRQDIKAPVWESPTDWVGDSSALLYR